VSIGTTASNEKLTVGGRIALDEQASEPLTISGYGKLVALTDESVLKFVNDGKQSDVLNFVGAVFKDTAASGTSGGGFSTGDWRTRPLDTVVFDNCADISLNTGTSVMTLNAGTYYISGHFSAYKVDGFRVRLRQTSGSAATLVLGGLEVALSLAAPYAHSPAHLTGFFTVASDSTTCEVQAYCKTSNATDGLGHAVGYSETECYGTVLIRKIK
jgi:hypothetical protein